MYGHCKTTGWLFPALILIFTLWPQGTWSKWVVIVAAALLLFHSLGCKSCHVDEAPKGKKKRRR